MNCVSFHFMCKYMCIFGINVSRTCIQRQTQNMYPKLVQILQMAILKKSTFLKKIQPYSWLLYDEVHVFPVHTTHVFTRGSNVKLKKVITNHPKVITKVVLTLHSSTYVCKLGKWFFICILMIHDEYSRYWLTSKNNIKLYFFASHTICMSFRCCTDDRYFRALHIYFSGTRS